MSDHRTPYLNAFGKVDNPSFVGSKVSDLG